MCTLHITLFFRYVTKHFTTLYIGAGRGRPTGALVMGFFREYSCFLRRHRLYWGKDSLRARLVDSFRLYRPTSFATQHSFVLPLPFFISSSLLFIVIFLGEFNKIFSILVVFTFQYSRDNVLRNRSLFIALGVENVHAMLGSTFQIYTSLS